MRLNRISARSWLLALYIVTAEDNGIDPSELHACASATFSRHVTNALLVLNANPDLYLDIQYLNPHRHEVYAATREALDHFETLVEGHEREGFRDALTAARRAMTSE